MLCGTDPLPELFRAKRYKIKQKFLTKSEFQFIMRNLPEEVSEADIEEMFAIADVDGDGKLSYKEFLTMIDPPVPSEQGNTSGKKVTIQLPTNDQDDYYTEESKTKSEN